LLVSTVKRWNAFPEGERGWVETAVPKEIKRISETVWEIPASYKQGMLVPARNYATEKLLQAMDDGVFDQVTNVATLPGIVSYALCMPDGHWGYGFHIGGVAAIDAEKGVISPGGIGFDINCGMRLVLTSLTYEEVRPNLRQLVDKLFQRVPYVEILKDKNIYHLTAEATGEKLNPLGHELLVDVKAVTLHRFTVKQTPEGWEATVILDI